MLQGSLKSMTIEDTGGQQMVAGFTSVGNSGEPKVFWSWGRIGAAMAKGLLLLLLRVESIVLSCFGYYSITLWKRDGVLVFYVWWGSMVFENVHGNVEMEGIQRNQWGTRDRGEIEAMILIGYYQIFLWLIMINLS